MVARLMGSALLSAVNSFQPLFQDLDPELFKNVTDSFSRPWPLGGAKSPVGVPLQLGN